MIAHHVPVTSKLMPSKKLRPKFKYSLILGDSLSLSLSVLLNPLTHQFYKRRERPTYMATLRVLEKSINLLFRLVFQEGSLAYF